MATEVTQDRPLTSEDLFALPDDPAVERWLMNGRLVERRLTAEELGGDLNVTRRNKSHATAEAALVGLVSVWLKAQQPPRGAIASGEAYFRLTTDPVTNVAIDVAYVSPEALADDDPKVPYYSGPPFMAAEILSPNDRESEIDEKVEAYLQSGVKLVLVVNPRLQTVAVYRPDAKPALFNADQEIAGDPHMPGLRIPVAAIFRH